MGADMEPSMAPAFTGTAETEDSRLEGECFVQR